METTKAGESTPRQIPTSAAGIGMLIVEPDRHHQKMRAAAPQTRCCSPRAAAIVIHTRVELVIRSTRVIRCCPQSAPKRPPPLLLLRSPPAALFARRPSRRRALPLGTGYPRATAARTPSHSSPLIRFVTTDLLQLPVVTTDLPELPPDTSPPTPLHRRHVTLPAGWAVQGPTPLVHAHAIVCAPSH